MRERELHGVSAHRDEGGLMKGKPTIEVLRAQQRELMKATRHFDDEAERVARVARVLEDLAADWSSRDGGAIVTRVARRVATDVLREEARAGATSLSIAWNGDGSADVRVNGGKPFRVQHRPALLLSIIAATDGNPADDGLVGWRSSADVTAVWVKHEHRAPTAAALTQAIYKLRVMFQAAEQNWLLVQTDRRKGMRFALRV
jgi:hypothetical protein